ncbi:MAG: META domain-containing protein [Treponema sp.]|jgi:heat shock protein HslJ|nr:META domain-containing protein [Treponema sp.]
MKRNPLFYVSFFCITLAACAGGSKAYSGSPMGVNWELAEIRTPEKTIVLDRRQLAADGMGDVFTIRFDGEDRASGKGAPNRYSAPCSWGDDSTVCIGTAAVTRMLAFKEPEDLKEGEFFNYLSMVNRWEITGGMLKLSFNNEDSGRRTVMVFTALP